MVFKIATFLFALLAIQAVEMSVESSNNFAAKTEKYNDDKKVALNLETLSAFLDTVSAILKNESMSEDDLTELTNIRTSLQRAHLSLKNESKPNDVKTQLDTYVQKIVAEISKLATEFDDNVISQIKSASQTAIDNAPGVFQNRRNEIHAALHQNPKRIANQIRSIADSIRESQRHVLNDQEEKIGKGILCVYAYGLREIVETLWNIAREESDAIFQIVVNLKTFTESLRRICETKTHSKNEKSMKHILDISGELLKIAENPLGTVQDAFRNVLIQYITHSNNWIMQFDDLLLEIAPIQRDAATKIQILENDVVTGLRSFFVISDRNNVTLVGLAQDFARDLASIIKSLDSHGEDLSKLSHDIRGISEVLGLITSAPDKFNSDFIRARFVDAVEESTGILLKLLWRPYNSKDEKLMTIINEFIATLKMQRTQLRSISQSDLGDQNTYLLSLQIQIATNNLALYLQDVPFYDESTKYNLDWCMENWADGFKKILRRLENEAVIKSDEKCQLFYDVLRQLKVIRADVRNLKTTTVYGTSRAFNTALQGVVLEIKALAWYAHFNKADDGNFDLVAKSVLVDYLSTLYRVQLGVNDVIYTVRQVQSARELAIQTRSNSRNLIEMVRAVLPVNSELSRTVFWPTRNFVWALENVKNKLKAEDGIVLEKIVAIMQQTLVDVHSGPTQALDPETFNQLTREIVAIERATDAMLRLSLDYQNVKSALVYFLTALQGFHAQLQTNIQLFECEEDPKFLGPQLQAATSALLDTVQLIELERDEEKFAPTLLVLLKELNLAKFEMEMVLTDYDKMVGVKEMCSQLSDDIKNMFVKSRDLLNNVRLVIKIGDSNFTTQDTAKWLLSTYSHALVLLTNLRGRVDQEGSNQERVDQIQTITDQLPLFIDTKEQANRALLMQALVYSRDIETLVEKLENEMDVPILTLKNIKRIASDIKKAIDSSPSELKIKLIAETQNLNGEIKELLGNNQNTFLRSILVDYLDAVKELSIGTRLFDSDSLQSLLTNIRYIRNQVAVAIQRLDFDVKLLTKPHIVKANISQIVDMAGMLIKITNNMVNQEIIADYLKPLKEIEASIQKFVQDGMNIENSFVESAELLQTASYHIEQMNWDMQLALESKKDENLEKLAKEVLTDFLITFQDVNIVLQSFA